MNVSRVVVVGALLLVVTGCDGTVEVTGKVKYKGNPIPNAELRLNHLEDTSIFVSGVSDESGTYTLSYDKGTSIPKGKYRITILWWLQRNGQPVPAGEEGNALKQSGRVLGLTATLEKEITSSDDALDFEIEGNVQRQPQDE